MTGFILTRESTDGSKRDDACWRVNGKQKSKTFTRRKQAERYLTDVVKKVQDGAYVEIKPTTFKAFAERWLEGLGNVKPSTRRAYVSIVTHQFVPAFGDQLLMALGVDDVNAWLRAREGRLRVKTLRNHLGLLHKILDDAREGGYLAVNRLHQSRALQRLTGAGNATGRPHRLRMRSSSQEGTVGRSTWTPSASACGGRRSRRPGGTCGSTASATRSRPC
jgi:hypothetical protein